MLTLLVLSLTFSAITMLSCYDFKKIHRHRVSFQWLNH